MMVNLKQVQEDLANGVMVCRKTIQDAIDYAVKIESAVVINVDCEPANISITGKNLQNAIAAGTRIANRSIPLSR